MSSPEFRRLRYALPFILLLIFGCDDTTGPDSVAKVEIEAPANQVNVGETLQLSARALDASGDEVTGVEVSWSSSDESIVTVNTGGLVAALTPGTATIRADANDVGASLSITVVSQPAALEVQADTTRVEIGDSTHYRAIVLDTEGQEILDATVTWSSDSSAIADVDAQGNVRGRMVGTTTIRATSGELSDSAEIEVVANVVIAPDTATLRVGESKHFDALVIDAEDDEPQVAAAAWTSDNALIATVDDNGDVQAVAPGSTVIRATSGGGSGAAHIDVSAIPVVNLGKELVSDDFDQRLTYLTAPPGGDPRLFVSTVNGEIWVIENGQRLPEMFLDLRDRVHAEEEQALTSFIFHPEYKTNGYFFVAYADLDNVFHVDRFTVSEDPNRADPTSRKEILSIPHPPTHMHYGGALQFGPEGNLFISVGDGGLPYSENGQRKDTLLGKILRIDIDHGDPYAIPTDNPFVDETGVPPEIWAYGLRNPWRIAVDDVEDLLYVADVGEGRWEEVNVVPVGEGGLNFGWRTFEGTHCFPESVVNCDPTGIEFPVLEYPHFGVEDGNGQAPGCSIIGGFVYRGNRIPSLRGHYLYGDLCGGWMGTFRYHSGEILHQNPWPIGGPNVSSFGQDSTGEIYILIGNGVWRIIAAP